MVIVLKKCKEDADEAIQRLNSIIQARKDFNNRFKRILTEEKSAEKRRTREKGNDTCNKRNDYENKVGLLKKKFNQFMTEEKEAKEKYRKAYYIKNTMKKNILQRY